VSAPVRLELSARSRGLCECCGFGGSTDRHHLVEYHLGGPNTVENLLVLCPSCHRQVPKHLSVEQQRRLQEWHHEMNRKGTISSTAALQSQLSSIDIGTVIFDDVRNVMATDDQNIITLHRDDAGISANIVMLDRRFQPNILVLSNKVIVDDGCEISTSRDRIVVTRDDHVWFDIASKDFITVIGRSRGRQHSARRRASDAPPGRRSGAGSSRDSGRQ
jgi:hypothetical protein